MSAPKRPRAGSGWHAIPVPPTLPPGSEAWARKRLVALSSLAGMHAPDGSEEVLPTWLVSLSRAGAAMPTDQDLRLARRDFGMRQAEEDNHQDGRARMLFLVVDPARRECCGTAHIEAWPVAWTIKRACACGLFDGPGAAAPAAALNIDDRDEDEGP